MQAHSTGPGDDAFDNRARRGIAHFDRVTERTVLHCLPGHGYCQTAGANSHAHPAATFDQHRRAQLCSIDGPPARYGAFDPIAQNLGRIANGGTAQAAHITFLNPQILRGKMLTGK